MFFVADGCTKCSCTQRASCKLVGARYDANSHRTRASATHGTVTDWTVASNVYGTFSQRSKHFIDMGVVRTANLIYNQKVRSVLAKR